MNTSNDTPLPTPLVDEPAASAELPQIDGPLVVEVIVANAFGHQLKGDKPVYAVRMNAPAAMRSSSARALGGALLKAADDADRLAGSQK